MRKLTDSERAALIETAETVGANPDSLYRLIQFESAWNPQAKNPTSSARGLIQFIDSTAADLGFTDSLELVTQFPTIEDQLLGPITTYLVQYGPFDNDQALFMAVFYPAARTWEPDDPFPDWVASANPGIETPADYMQAVYAAHPMTPEQIAAAIGLPGAALGGATIILIVGAALALVYYNSQT
jgi:hypothetical protein